MSQPSHTDPKVVLRAHALRTSATIQAALHGGRSPRTRRHLLGGIYGSLSVAVIIAIAVIVTGRIVSALHR
jgi:hypothetical protein